MEKVYGKEELEDLSLFHLKKLSREQGYNPNLPKKKLIEQLLKRDHSKRIKPPSCFLLTLPTELISQIGRELSYRDVLRLEQTCRRFHGIFDSPSFWKSRILTEFEDWTYGLDPEEYKPKYITLVTELLEAKLKKSPDDVRLDEIKQKIDTLSKQLYPSVKWELLTLNGEGRKLEEKINPLKKIINRNWRWIRKNFEFETERRFILVTYPGGKIPELLRWLAAVKFFPNGKQTESDELLGFQKTLKDLGKIHHLKDGHLIGIYDESNLHLRPALVYVLRTDYLQFGQIIPSYEIDFPKELKEEIKFLEGEDDLFEKINRIYKINL